MIRFTIVLAYVSSPAVNITISNNSLHFNKNSFKKGLNSNVQLNLGSALLYLILPSKELCINVSSKSNTKVLALDKSLGPNHTFYQNDV